MAPAFHLIASATLLGLILSRTAYFFVAFQSKTPPLGHVPLVSNPNSLKPTSQNESTSKTQKQPRSRSKAPKRFVPTTDSAPAIIVPSEPYRTPLPPHVPDAIREEVWGILDEPHFPACTVIVQQRPETALRYKYFFSVQSTQDVQRWLAAALSVDASAVNLFVGEDPAEGGLLQRHCGVYNIAFFHVEISA